jgi:hypothetical protein
MQKVLAGLMCVHFHVFKAYKSLPTLTYSRLEMNQVKPKLHKLMGRRIEGNACILGELKQL